ncbi:MAG: tRNA-dihydrouridine synthase family protein [Treponema sp.]|nr:tRNA-dihydrouridine synthase family protein [Treponema sp.]
MLAPMAEISHRALRELIEGFMNGKGDRPEYLTEMLSAAAILGGGPFEAWYLDAGPCPERLVYQLGGPDPARLEGAAALLEKRDCLGIDLNMGCAAPAIRRSGAGITWMADPDRARAMVGRVRRVTRRRLSVKLRLGPPGQRPSGQGSPGQGPGEQEKLSPETTRPSVDGALFEYLVRFCRGLEAEGVQLITLHPRLAGEKFKRRARWDYVEALRRELRIPVAGNGDIADAAELLRRSGEGRVMVGRAAVRQPWIFAEAWAHAEAAAGQGAGQPGDQTSVPPIHPISPINLEETGLRFLELLARYQPPEFHISRARRFFSYFCDNLTWGTHVNNLLNREETLRDIARVWRGYFSANKDAHLGRP